VLNLLFQLADDAPVS